MNVNVTIVILTFLEWDFQLEALSYCRTNFLCKKPSQMEKVHLKWTFSLNHDFITEPIFRNLKSLRNAYKKYFLF